jgi:hypothetical protein
VISNFEFRISNLRAPSVHRDGVRKFEIRNSKFEMLVLVTVLLGTLGCGKEAAPQPPILRIAERTTDLAAVQEGTEAVLSWGYPAMTTAGEALTEIEAIEIWRAPLPAAQAPPPAMDPRGRQLERQLLESQGEVVATLGPEALSEATRGASLVWRDDLARWRLQAGADAENVVLWYGVRTICCRKRASELSNVARLLPAEPPPPPAGLRLTAGAEGIELRWQPVPELLTLVERSPDGALWVAVSEEPVRGGSFRDATAEQGRAWSYRLRSVARLPAGGRVVGEPSPPERLEHPDTYPPPAPEAVVCLPEGTRVRVRWEAAPGASDYEVTRRLADGSSELLASAFTATELVDPSPPQGEVSYLVVARDEIGNASVAATCSVVMGELP